MYLVQPVSYMKFLSGTMVNRCNADVVSFFHPALLITVFSGRHFSSPVYRIVHFCCPWLVSREKLFGIIATAGITAVNLFSVSFENICMNLGDKLTGKFVDIFPWYRISNDLKSMDLLKILENYGNSVSGKLSEYRKSRKRKVCNIVQILNRITGKLFRCYGNGIL